MNRIIPTVVDRSGASDIYSKLLDKSRIIFLCSDIDDQVASIICAQLLYLDAGEKGSGKNIHLYINSPGGVLSAGFAIYDTMQYIKSPIATYGLGQVASAASLLLAAGTKGERYILPNTRVLIHQPLIQGGGLKGQETDIRLHSQEMTRMRKQAERVLVLHTGKTEEEINTDCERDFILSAQAAVDYGIADHILEGKKS